MSASNRSAQQIRLGLLFGVLALMLFAWWYDWKVARVRVESAFESVEALNKKLNARASGPTTSVEVQETLHRKPARTMKVGEYDVEVYSWIAGLPFRTHDYFAVYSQVNGKSVLATHFKFTLPEEELQVKVRRSPVKPVPPIAGMPMSSGGGGRSRQPKEDRKSDEKATSGEAKSEGAAENGSSDAKAETPKDAAPAAKEDGSGSAEGSGAPPSTEKPKE
jgi:hypothetical protein